MAEYKFRLERDEEVVINADTLEEAEVLLKEHEDERAKNAKNITVKLFKKQHGKHHGVFTSNPNQWGDEAGDAVALLTYDASGSYEEQWWYSLNTLRVILPDTSEMPLEKTMRAVLELCSSAQFRGASIVFISPRGADAGYFCGNGR